MFFVTNIGSDCGNNGTDTDKNVDDSGKKCHLTEKEGNQIEIKEANKSPV